MSEQKHTPEPWKLDWDGDNLDCIHNDYSVIAMAIGSHDPDDAYIKITRQDAERIVACVNALAGMDDPAAEIARLRTENDTLRGLLGNSALPCVYCGLPANEQGKCERGFPGCPRSDDEQLSHLFAIEYDNECMRKDIETLRDALEYCIRHTKYFTGINRLVAEQFSDIAREALAKVARKETTDEQD